MGHYGLIQSVVPKKIHNGWDDLGTPEVRMAVAALAEEQKVDALLFFNNNIEALAALPSGPGSLAVELAKDLLDCMFTFEPNTGLFQVLGALATLQWKQLPACFLNFKKFRFSQGWLQAH